MFQTLQKGNYIVTVEDGNAIKFLEKLLKNNS